MTDAMESKRPTGLTQANRNAMPWSVSTWWLVGLVALFVALEVTIIVLIA